MISSNQLTCDAIGAPVGSVNASSYSPMTTISSTIVETSNDEWPAQQAVPFLITALGATVLLTYLYCDYRAFLALGPGGTPSTVLGYARVKMLSFFALRNPYVWSSYVSPESGFLTDLPRRGPRPVSRGIAPHRQVDQRATKALYERMFQSIRQLSANSGHRIGTSHFEKHNLGVFSTSPERRSDHGEICHAHPSDGSMHMTLHPADVKIVLEAQWGERHPLARGGRFARFVPETFVMIYAPKSEQDIETVLEIVRASAWYIGGAG